MPFNKTLDLWWLSAKPPSTAALHVVLGHYRSGPHNEWVRDAHGKPQVSEGQGPNFSVAHADGWTLIGVCGEQPVGVDCEKLRNFEDHRGVEGLAFSEREVAWIEQDGARSSLPRFFALWTRKEAVVKAIGLGLQLPLRDFDIVAADLMEPMATDVPGHGRWWVSSVAGPAGFAAACACRERFDPAVRKEAAAV